MITNHLSNFLDDAGRVEYAQHHLSSKIKPYYENNMKKQQRLRFKQFLEKCYTKKIIRRWSLLSVFQHFQQTARLPISPGYRHSLPREGYKWLSQCGAR